jgi:uncharacterized membrane protein YphA (DoxX/SURF4 family)
MHILPSTAREFWFTRWFCGVIAPLVLSGCGIYSLTTKHSYVLARNQPYCILEVTGFKATLMAIVFFGFALALFSACHAPYSKLSNYSQYGETIGLLAACIGIFWCYWLILIGG